jgi:lysophospholipase L1-like esterase
MFTCIRQTSILCLVLCTLAPAQSKGQNNSAQGTASGAIPSTAPATAINSTVFLGDSITAFGNAYETGPSNTFGWGWTAQATFLSKGRILQVNNAGVPGNTLEQMLARFPTDVTPYSPTRVVIAGGTNDIPATAFTSAELSSITSTLGSIIDMAEATGIQPIVCNVPPREDAPVAIHEANAKALSAAIQTLATTKQTQYGNVVFFNLYSIVVNPSTGGYLPGYDLGDGIHPSLKAATAIANAFVSTTTMVYGSSVYLPWVNSSALNLIPNSLFIKAIGSSWSAGYGTSPAPTVTEVTGDPHIAGNWMQIEFPPATAAGQYYSYNADNIAVTSGATYALAFRFQISGLEANGGMVVVTFGYNGPNVGYNMTEDVADGTFYIEAPAASGQANPGIIVYPGLTGTITVRMAQVGLTPR